jgi:hypothetical protein
VIPDLDRVKLVDFPLDRFEAIIIVLFGSNNDVQAKVKTMVDLLDVTGKCIINDDIDKYGICPHNI